MARIADGPLDVRRDLQRRDAGTGGDDRADGGWQSGTDHGPRDRPDHRGAEADAAAGGARRASRQGVRRAAQHGQRREACRDRLLQLPGGEGQYRRQLSQRRRIDRQRPAALEAGGLRRRHGRSLRRQRAEDAGREVAQRRRLRARRARRARGSGKRRAGRCRRVPALARCVVACPQSQGAEGLGRAGEVASDDDRRESRHPGCSVRQDRAAAAAGTRMGRGRREDVPRQGPRAASPVRGHVRVAARRLQGGRGRPRRHPRHAGMARRQGHGPVTRRCARCAHRRSAASLHLQRGRRRRRSRRTAARDGDAHRSHGSAVQEGRPLSRARRARRADQRLRHQSPQESRAGEGHRRADSVSR